MFKWIDIQLYFREVPGGEDKHLPYRLDRQTIDDAFEHGGLPAVEEFFGMALGQVFDQLKGELMKPYKQAAKELREAQKGPLGFLADIALAKHEHRTGRSKRDEGRDLPPDVQL